MNVIRKAFLIGTVILCSSITTNAIVGKNDFEGYKVFRLKPQNPEQIKKLLSEISRGMNDLDILKSSRFSGDTTDILISPQKSSDLQRMALKYKVPFENTVNNFRDLLEINDQQNRRASKSDTIFKYRSFEETQRFLYNVSKTYESCVTIDTIGRSYEKRKLYMVKISKNPLKQKPIILVDALIHAREWAAGAMATYLIQEVSRACKTKSALLDVDWYIIPIVNPDGYEYSRTSIGNRMWRKTRSDVGNTKCKGVDGNRNYGWHWGESGVSQFKCDETYPGDKPFSEVETRAVAKVMKDYKKVIKLYVSLHAYGDYLVYPFGYTGDSLPKEWKKLDNLAQIVNEAIVKAGGKPFNVTSAGKWYAAAGGSDDYAFGANAIPYSYTMELTTKYGFSFPERGLKNYLPNVMKGFDVFCSEILREFR